MGSRKYRSKLRAIRIRHLCIKAVQLYGKREEDRLYLQELANLHHPYGTPIEIMRPAVRMAKMKWFGYGYSLFKEWWLGFKKFRFVAKPNGKVRAEDIMVIED